MLEVYHHVQQLKLMCLYAVDWLTYISSIQFDRRFDLVLGCSVWRFVFDLREILICIGLVIKILSDPRSFIYFWLLPNIECFLFHWLSSFLVARRQQLILSLSVSLVLVQSCFIHCWALVANLWLFYSVSGGIIANLSSKNFYCLIATM